MPDRSGQTALRVTTALGGAVRLAHLLFLSARDPLFRVPVSDAGFHAAEALAILERGPLLRGTGAFYKGPLLSYVYALLFAMFGPDPGIVAMRVLNAVLGTAAVWFAARVALRLGGARAAWGAGLAVAFYGTAVYYDTTLLQPALLAVLMLAVADRLIRALDNADPTRPLLVAGALLGLLTVTRGEGLLVGVVCAGWAAAVAGSAAWGGMPRWRAAALILVPQLLIVAPVTARNTLLEHDPVVVSWNGGINLFMGNDPAFDQGGGNWNADLAWTRLDGAPPLLGLVRGSDHQRFFIGQAASAALAHPLRAAGILAHKSALLLTGYEISSNRRIYEARGKSPILAVLMFKWRWFAFPFGIAAPLIAAGIVLGRRSLGAGAIPPLLIAVSTAVIPVIFFNTARYRLPAILVAIPVAAAGVARSGSAPARARTAAAVLAVVLAVIAGATMPARPALPPSDAYNLADLAHDAHRGADELRYREQAVREEPADPGNRFHLGEALLAQGRPDESVTQFEALLAMRGLDADWYNAATLSVAHARFVMRQYDRAIEAYRSFVAANPDRPMTGSRPDFHLLGPPPLEACAARLDLARALAGAGRVADAGNECRGVARDCGESRRLVGEANEELRGIAAGGARAPAVSDPAAPGPGIRPREAK